MADYLPFLYDKSILTKFATLILIIAVSLVLTMVLGLIIAIPIFGTEILFSMNSQYDFGDQTTISFLKFVQVINQLGLFILPVLFFAWLANRNLGEYLGLNRTPAAVSLLLSIGVIMASIPAINWMVELNQQMNLPDFLSGIENWMKETEDKTNRLTEVFLNVNSITGLVINIIIIALLAAVGEEFLFRGVVLKLFYEWLKNAHLAVFISAILFSAMHLQFYGFLPRTILGVLIGYIYVWTGVLWIPIILHFIFNGLTVVAAYLYNQGQITIDAETFGTSDNKFVIIGSFIVTIVFLVLIYLNREKALTLKKKKGIIP